MPHHSGAVSEGLEAPADKSENGKKDRETKLRGRRVCFVLFFFFTKKAKKEERTC